MVSKEQRLILTGRFDPRAGRTAVQETVYWRQQFGKGVIHQMASLESLWHEEEQRE